MQHTDWLERWTTGNTRWHEDSVNEDLKNFWAPPVEGGRVLVPLCGKSMDVLWLAERGFDVSGVELSVVAIEGFFSDHGLTYNLETAGALTSYRAVECPVTLYCGDYFQFGAPKFDALYDRASLIALDAALRPAYVRHTQTLLKEDAYQLLVTLEYDQQLVDGPPYCVMAEEVRAYWPGLRCVREQEALASCPPKFTEAGVPQVNEVTWISK